jgi:CubicO group peptidase (beta-lactamase class C family)
MKYMVRALILILAGLSVISCASPLHDTSEETSYLKTESAAREIGTALTEGDGAVTAASIAVMHEGELIFSQGFGLRDIDENLPVDRYTQFNIGSVSKVFTAASILLLQQEGRIDLDDRVSEILPEFTMADERYRDITVRMLLSHTSGLPGTNMRNGFASEFSQSYLMETMTLLEESALKHEPGAFSPYCNDGFTLAQAVIEHHSGLSYDEFLEKNLFTSLGMEDTSVGFSPAAADRAYAYADRSFRLPLEYVNITASGGITSTAEDLCRFAKLLFAPGILTDDSLQEFLAEQKPDTADDAGWDRFYTFGLGWDLTSYDLGRDAGLQILGKTGGTTQYTAMLFVVPDTRSAVALICSGQADPIASASPILKALLEETGTIALQQTETASAAEPSVKTLPTDYALYEGYYVSGRTVHLIGFDPDSSSLQIRSYDGSAFTPDITAVHAGEALFLGDDGNRYTLRTVGGSRAVLKLHPPYDRAEILMTRLPDLTEASAHEFIEGVWLPSSLTPHDLYFQPFSTTFLEELPSYFILNGSSIAAYAITDRDRTSMVLPALRDQQPPKISPEGDLLIGGYRCLNAAGVTPLEENERVQSGNGNSAVWRKISGKGTLTGTIPDGGRVIVLSKDFSYNYDTLYFSTEGFAVEMDGGYAACIAEEPALFELEFILSEEF